MSFEMYSDDSNDFNDLEVAEVLARASKTTNDGSTVEPETSLSTSSISSSSLGEFSPNSKMSTLVTNVPRGNTICITPLDLTVVWSVNRLAAMGELVTLKQAINDENINEADDFGKTPLMTAAAAGWFHVVTFLLSRGAPVDTVDKQGSTALIQASSLGHRKIVKCLLENDADVNAVCLNGNSSLHYAVFTRHVDCVELLLKWGCDVTIENNDGVTALLLAARLGYRDIEDAVSHHLLQLIQKYPTVLPQLRDLSGS